MENNNPFSTPQNSTELLDGTAAPQDTSATVVDMSASAPEAAQPAQPVQQAYNPYQTAQPVQAAAPQQPYNPYQTVYSYQPTAAAGTSKRSVGKIISLIIGIILTILGAFWLFATVMVFIDDFNTYGEVEISIPVLIIFSLPLIIGIILTVFGAKKKKINTVTPAANNYYAVPQPTAYAPTTVPTAVPTAAPVNQTAAPTVQTTAAPVNQTADPTVQTTAAPVNQTADPTVQTTASAYQYAPTVTIQDDSMAMAKKTARKNGLIAIAIVVVMWLILLFTGYIFWYLLIIPIIMAVTALKNNIKSIAGWASLILSILSVILFIVLLISLV